MGIVNRIQQASREVAVASARRFAALGGRFRRDRRGGTAVQMIVMLPVIVIAFMGLVRVWQVIQIRDSLHTGTYLATRYLSLYPPETTDTYIWSQIAEKFVYEQLRTNPWVDQTSLISGSPFSRVEVTLDTGGYDCTNPFTVRATLTISVMAGDLTSQGFPNPLQLELVDERKGEVLCQ